ncbi:MAG TPA: nuclear transport factor 2 family protein, partial [Myxococcota bacterium]|nr:nuclear transport factor 2 family protein [Myxococcota bacterium]
MASPSREALLEWAKGYVEHWNSGDKEAWVANWKKVAPGDFVMLDPVGTPPKSGFEGCAAEPYDLFQPSTHFHVDPATMFVCGNEVAWVMENTFTKDGETSLMRSIEVYRFGEDGSVEIRTHYDVPESSDP